MTALADFYHNGEHGLQQDLAKALELYARAAKLGSSKAHFSLAIHYHEGGNTYEEGQVALRGFSYGWT
jgi:TPR repeat protein